MNNTAMKKIFLLLLCLGSASSSYSQPLIGMGNPFSFDVEGVDFSEATTSEEKSEWGIRVQSGEDPMKVAQEILRRKMLKRRKRAAS